MSTTAVAQPETIPLTSLAASSMADSDADPPHALEPAHIHHAINTNTEFEVGPAHDEFNDADTAAPDAEALPAYKEHDMEEPLPPYMARVRMVMRREMPMATIMERRIGGFILAGIVPVVVIAIAVSVGVNVRGNKNGGGNGQ